MTAADPWGIAAAIGELRAELAAAREELAELRRAQADDPLRPLSAILSISPRAALGRIDRDPGLRKLGVRVGRRLLYRSADVQAYYRRVRP